MISRVLSTILFVLILTIGSAQAGGDAARGAELAVDCADCHGDDGAGDDESPALAGLDQAYHVEQLQAFKSGERDDESEMMAMYVEDLSEQDMADLAAYYASIGGN